MSKHNLFLPILFSVLSLGCAFMAGVRFNRLEERDIAPGVIDTVMAVGYAFATVITARKGVEK